MKFRYTGLLSIAALGVGLNALAYVLPLQKRAPEPAPVKVEVLEPVKTISELEPQRRRFKRALDKLNSGDVAAYTSLKAQLADYPLFPYLEYNELKRDLKAADETRLDDFFSRYPDLHLSDYLRGSWLYVLARERRWEDFLAYFDGRDDSKLQCYAVVAEIEQGKADVSLLKQKASQLWLTGKNQPASCDPVFEWLRAEGELSDELVRQRMLLALEQRNWSLAAYLYKQLPGKADKAYQAWQQIRENPKAISKWRYRKDSPLHRELGIYAVNRVLAQDLAAADKLWQKLQRRYDYPDEERFALTRKLAKRSAQRHLDDALEYLAAVPEAAVDAEIREWRVRAALRAQDWERVREYLVAMPEAEQQRDEWLYWRGRAEEELQHPQAAELAYGVLAKKRGYHAFMAAERLGQGYQFTPEPLEVGRVRLIKTERQAGILRARELFTLGQIHMARVEWYRAIKPLNEEGLRAAAQLAHQWQWHEMAIRLAAKLNHYDDLELRFAMPHRDAVEHSSEKVSIDPNWAQAIMRRESAYASDARSGVGARGLMQLMPATAKHIAQRKGWRWSGAGILNQPDTNIRYGTAYLAELNRRMKGEIALATAAYNAGPHRVKQWLPEEAALPLDVWVDTIPFDETRKYVHAVSEYMMIFHWKAAGQPEQLEPSLQYTQKQVSQRLLLASN